MIGHTESDDYADIPSGSFTYPWEAYQSFVYSMDATLGHWNWGVSIYPVNIIMSAHLNKDNHLVMLGVSIDEGEPVMIAIEMDIASGEITKQMKIKTHTPPIKIIGLFSDVKQREVGPYFYYIVIIQNEYWTDMSVYPNVERNTF
jgi:hypothetical protein